MRTTSQAGKSQNKAITYYMLKGGKVTQLMAYTRFQCVNLSGRISEISKVHSITKEWVKVRSGKRVIRYGIAFTLMLFLLSSCADVETVEQCVTGHEYGFWGGLWHGMILLFSFIGSLFTDDIAIYATNNNGGWYNFGFFLGVCASGLGAYSSKN